jgi:hypothetical protein
MTAACHEPRTIASSARRNLRCEQALPTSAETRDIRMNVCTGLRLALRKRRVERCAQGHNLFGSPVTMASNHGVRFFAALRQRDGDGASQTIASAIGGSWEERAGTAPRNGGKRVRRGKKRARETRVQPCCTSTMVAKGLGANRYICWNPGEATPDLQLKVDRTVPEHCYCCSAPEDAGTQRATAPVAKLRAANWLKPSLRVYTNATAGFSGLDRIRGRKPDTVGSSPRRCATLQIASSDATLQRAQPRPKLKDWSGISRKDTKLRCAGLLTATETR